MGKLRWPPKPMIGWDIFDFFSETTEKKSTKLYRKQDLNVLFQVCVFRHFRFLLWNRWTEFTDTWQEARSQHPLPSLCFRADRKKTRWPPLPLIGWAIFDLSSETAERTTSSSKFVLFGPMSKQKCLRWLMCQKGGPLYSGARYVAPWTSCYVKYYLWYSEAVPDLRPFGFLFAFWTNLTNMAVMLSDKLW